MDAEVHKASSKWEMGPEVCYGSLLFLRLSHSVRY